MRWTRGTNRFSAVPLPEIWACFPLSILPFAIPLSILEVFVAVAIMRKIGTPSRS